MTSTLPSVTEPLEPTQNASPTVQPVLYQSELPSASRGHVSKSRPRLGTDEFWVEYRKYLLANMRENTVRLKLSYTKRYWQVLETGDASPLLTMPYYKRADVMKALSSLSKYLGCYQRWIGIRQSHQLKWSDEAATMAAFQEMVDSRKGYGTMLAWLKDTVQKIPEAYANTPLYCTLTGLRPDEACQSIKLVQSESAGGEQTGDTSYLNREKMVLEHFRHPRVFIRRTKKAYISIVTPEILEVANNADAQGYNAIRLAVSHRRLAMNMGYCRKIFGTFMRTSGIESEIIDLLQGRLPKTVFARHYFRPDFDEQCERIRNYISSLQQSIF